MRSNCPCTSLPGILASYSSLESIKTARQIHDFIQNCKKLLGLFRCKRTIFFVFPAVQAGPGIRRFHVQDENDAEPLVQVGCWGVGVGLKHVHRLLNQRIRLLALRTLLGSFVAGRLFASVQLRHYGACWQCPVLLRWTAMRLLVAGR